MTNIIQLTAYLRIFTEFIKAIVQAIDFTGIDGIRKHIINTQVSSFFQFQLRSQLKKLLNL